MPIRKRVKQLRSVEIQTQKFLDRLISLAYHGILQNVQKSPNMFIEDRGTSANSCIKGFRKYGGRWEERMHDKNVIVCITDEHLVSQTFILLPEALPFNRQYNKEQ